MKLWTIFWKNSMGLICEKIHSQAVPERHAGAGSHTVCGLFGHTCYKQVKSNVKHRLEEDIVKPVVKKCPVLVAPGCIIRLISPVVKSDGRLCMICSETAGYRFAKIYRYHRFYTLDAQMAKSDTRGLIFTAPIYCGSVIVHTSACMRALPVCRR